MWQDTKSVCKNQLHFYILAMNSAKLKLRIPFKVSIKKNKMLWDKFSKTVQDLYTENYKTLKLKKTQIWFCCWYCTACGILVPHPETEPEPPAVDVCSPVREFPDKWKDIPYSWIRRLGGVKRAIVLKLF